MAGCCLGWAGWGVSRSPPPASTGALKGLAPSTPKREWRVRILLCLFMFLSTVSGWFCVSFPLQTSPPKKRHPQSNKPHLARAPPLLSGKPGCHGGAFLFSVAVQRSMPAFSFTTSERSQVSGPHGHVRPRVPRSRHLSKGSCTYCCTLLLISISVNISRDNWGVCGGRTERSAREVPGSLGRILVWPRAVLGGGRQACVLLPFRRPSRSRDEPSATCCSSC